MNSTTVTSSQSGVGNLQELMLHTHCIYKLVITNARAVDVAGAQDGDFVGLLVEVLKQATTILHN